MFENDYKRKLRDDKLLFLTTDEYDLDVYLDAQERIKNTKAEFDIIVKERIKSSFPYQMFEVLQNRDNYGEIINQSYINDIIRDENLHCKIEYNRNLIVLTYGVVYNNRNYFEAYYNIEVSTDIISCDYFRVINVQTYINRDEYKREKMLIKKHT